MVILVTGYSWSCPGLHDLILENCDKWKQNCAEDMMLTSNLYINLTLIAGVLLVCQLIISELHDVPVMTYISHRTRHTTAQYICSITCTEHNILCCITQYSGMTYMSRSAPHNSYTALYTRSTTHMQHYIYTA